MKEIFRFIDCRLGDWNRHRIRQHPKSPNLQSHNLQSGQVLVWMVVLLPLLLALLGLVFDGGLMWAQFRRARWAADGAAVAAASDIDRELYRDQGQVRLTEQALYTAIYYARENDPNLSIHAVYVLDNVIYVRGQVHVEPVFLGLFGVDGLALDVRGQERPAWGISQEGE